MKQLKRDLITYPVLIMLMVVLLFDARSIPDSIFEPVGGRFLAQFIPALIILLSVVGLVRNRMSGRDARGASIGDLSTTLQLFGLLFLYALGLTVGGGLFGFTLVSAVFVLAMAWVLYQGSRPTPSEVVWISALAVGLPLGIGLVFTRLLFVNLP